MREIQEKILNAIELAIKESQAPRSRGRYTGLEAVIRPGYANTGNVYAQEGFRTAFVFGYQFNDTYCSLTLSGEVVERELHPQNNTVLTKESRRTGVIYRTVDIDVEPWETTEPPTYRVDETKPMVRWYKLDYDEGDKIEEMLALVNYLARRGL